MDDKNEGNISVFSEDTSPQVDKPEPSGMEKASMILLPFGIMIALIPFVVKFLGGMRTMSDPMVMIAGLGIVMAIIGAILLIIVKSKAAKQN